MYTKRYSLFAIVIVLVAVTMACNLPSVAAPTPFVFPTPNFTLTALFYPTSMPPTRTSLPLIFQTVTPIVTNSTNVPSASASQTPTQIQPTPTKTQKPTESYVGPEERKGPSVVAVYMDQAPTLDGIFDEWLLNRYDASNVVMGKSEWSSSSDLSGNFMVGWNEDYLFIAARVKDDKYKQNASDENLFKGDSLEILMDTVVPDDFHQNGLSGDDYQLGISPGSPQPGTNPQAYLWYPKSKTGEKGEVKIGAMATDDGYRVEAKIPWDLFNVNAKVGKHFGFAFSISDNDKSGENVQQSMVSNDGLRILDDPTTWGDLTLAGGPTSKTRPGPSISASYLNSAPTIDGNLGDWSLSPITVKNIVYGKNNWEGLSDLSGDVMLGWDNDNLYIGVKVKDDLYVQNASGVNLFKGDSLEILLDQDLVGDFSSTILSSDDFQLGISPGSPTAGDHPQAYLWYPNSKAGKQSQVIIAAKPVANGYQVEAAIPWSMFGISPAHGQHFGFSFSISDNDNTNKDVQQSMVSNILTRILTDPSTWGDLTLIKP